jgi:hypothetical protein
VADTGDDSRSVDDELSVLCWRMELLGRLGYDRRAAARLASSRVDVHELERLISRGCPPSTAARTAA